MSPKPDDASNTRPAAVSEDDRPHRPYTGLVQIVVVVALVVLAFVFSRAPSKEDALAGSDAVLAGQMSTTAPAPLVNVIHPEPSTNTLRINATGTIKVRTYVALTPQVNGRVVWLADAMRAGGAFRANEALLRIDRRDFDLAVAQASADVASAESTLKLQEAEGAAARANYGLVHPNAPVPPLVAKTPQIDQAKAQLASSRARLAIAKLELSRAEFSLPFSGRIIETTAETGQVLTRGQSFGQAFADQAIELVVPVAGAELALIEPAVGRRATVRAGKIEFTATVERMSAELDERSRFARLYLAIDGGGAPVPPGTFVNVELEGRVVGPTFVLPEATEQLAGSVWIVANGTLQRRQPQLQGRISTGLVVDAFDIGEGVVVGAVPGGVEGQAVRIAGPGS